MISIEAMESVTMTPPLTTQFAGYALQTAVYPPLTEMLPLRVKLLLLVMVGTALYAHKFRRASRPQGTGRQGKRSHEEEFSAAEVVMESILGFLTRMAVKAYEWTAAKTRGALIINALANKRIIIAGPALERALGRHADDTSLAHNILLVGRRMFDLGDETVESIHDYNTRPGHKLAFSAVGSARALVEAITDCSLASLDAQPDEQETALGSWLFKLMVVAMTTAVWGPANPWAMDDGFLDRFITFTFCLPTLLRPFPGLTARRAQKARKDVLARLQSFHARHRQSRVQQLAQRINLVALTDASWETNPDYFKVELLTAQGLTVTPSAMTVWLVRHLLSSRQTMERVLAEVRSDGLDSGTPGDKLDVARIRRECPNLVASVHETLRLHMTGIPRVARDHFEVPMPNKGEGMLGINKGDVIMLPMASFNKKAEIWGADVGSFRPERFLVRGPDGVERVSEAAVRKLRTFGVAGNMCPGRKVGFDAVVFVAATVLRGFDIEPVGGVRGEAPEPVASEDANIGFERVGDEVRVRMKRV